MAGGVTAWSAHAGYASVFILLSAGFAASAPQTTLPVGGYNGFLEKVWHGHELLMMLVFKKFRSISACGVPTKASCGVADVLEHNHERHFSRLRKLDSKLHLSCPKLDLCYSAGVLEHECE